MERVRLFLAESGATTAPTLDVAESGATTAPTPSVADPPRHQHA